MLTSSPPTPQRRPLASQIAFWIWLAAFPLTAALLYGAVASSGSVAIAYALPYLGIAALLGVPLLALLSGAVTGSLKASLLGTALGLPLALVGAMLISGFSRNHDNRQWQAEYDEFRAFGEVVLDGDRASIAAAMGRLQYFTPAETLCTLGAGTGSGGLGYLLPDRPVVGRDAVGQGYVIPNDRLLLVADIIVSSHADVPEKQTALYNVLVALAGRDAKPLYPDWLALWMRTKSRASATDPLHFDGHYDRPLKGYCQGGDDAALAALAGTMRPSPATGPDDRVTLPAPPALPSKP